MAVSVMRRIVSLETDARRSPKCAEISSVVSLLAYNEKQGANGDGTNVGGRSRVDRVLPRLRIVVLVPQGIEHGAGRAADVPGDPTVR